MGSCVPLAFSKNRSTHKYGDTIPSLLRIILFCASYPRLTLNHFVNNFLFHFLKVFWSSSLITLFPYSYCLMKQWLQSHWPLYSLIVNWDEENRLLTRNGALVVTGMKFRLLIRSGKDYLCDHKFLIPVYRAVYSDGERSSGRTFF